MEQNQEQSTAIFQGIRNYLKPVFYDSLVNQQRSGLLNIVLIISITASVISLVSLLFVSSEQSQQALIPLSILVALSTNYVVYRLGHLNIAARGTILSLGLTLIASIAITSINLTGIGIVSFASMILMTGLVINGSAAVIAAIIFSAASVAIYVGQSQGLLPANDTDLTEPVLYAVVATINFIFMGVLLRAGTNVLWLTQTNLQKVNESLNRAQTNLEILVSKRTRNLELAADVGTQISQIRDLEELLIKAVGIIKKSFSLYHTQIYLTDSTGRNLALKASAGEVGQKLIQQGHRLAIGIDSINGSAAQRRETVLEEDTRAQSSLFKPNTLLISTRSELAVPMIVSERLIGVLNLQSDEVGGLSEENKYVFETIASQLAVAIENANLFVQLQRTQEEITAQARRLTQIGWQSFLDSVEEGDRLRYSYNLADVAPKISYQADTLNSIVYAAPITVSGAEVGVIQIENDPDFSWSEEDGELVQAIASQVAQKIENLRLLNDANRFRREAEQSLRKLTRDNWDSYLNSSATKRAGYMYDGRNIRDNSDTQKADARYNVKSLVIQGEPIGEISTSETEVSQEASNEIITAVAQSLSTHIETLRLAEQTEQRVLELSVINQINDVVKANLDLEQLIHQVGHVIHKSFSSDSVTIGLVSANQRFLEFPLILIEDEKGDIELRQTEPVKRGDGLSWKIIESKKPILLEPINRQKVSEMGAIVRFTDTLPQQDDFSILGVPLTAGHDVLGVITLQNRAEKRQFTLADQKLLQTLGGSIGIGLRNAQLFLQTQEILAETENLYNASISFNRANTIENVMESFVETLGLLANVSGSAYWKITYNAQQEIQGVRIVNVWRPHDQQTRIPVGTILDQKQTPSVAHWTENHNKIHLINNIETHELTKDDQTFVSLLQNLGIKSFAIIPLTIGARWVGIITFQWNNVIDFTNREYRLFVGLAAQVSTTIDSIEQLQQTAQRAQHEQLLNDITQKIQGTVSVDKALQTTVQELSKTLKLRKARIRLQRPNISKGQG